MNNRFANFRIKAACPLVRSSWPLILTLLAFSLNCLPALAQQVLPGERTSLDAGWRFVKGDPVEAQGKLDYNEIKDWVEATGAEFTTHADVTAKPKPTGDPG